MNPNLHSGKGDESMFKNMIPWKKKERALSQGREKDPFLELHRSMNALFDHFFDRYDSFPNLKPHWLTEKRLTTPEVNITENEKDFLVEALLPGYDEKDIKVGLDGNYLLLEGRRREIKEEKNKKLFFSENRFENFYRRIPLPGNQIDEEKIKAELKKGILKITLPKIPGTESHRKKIRIATG